MTALSSPALLVLGATREQCGLSELTPNHRSSRASRSAGAKFSTGNLRSVSMSNHFSVPQKSNEAPGFK